MVAGEIGPEVRSFLARHVRTLDDLQFLMAIMQSGDRWWDVPSTARELGTSYADARALLERFAAHNLMDIRVTDDVRYQFSPGSSELREAARATADAYRANPLALARLVGAAGGRGIADFADAFRIRREHDDR